MGDRVRIANASGYWGDDPEALARQVRSGTVDYVTLDFLAEITILQRQRAPNPSLGYAYDFVEMLAPVLPDVVREGIRIAQGLLTLELDVPESVLAATPADGEG